MVDALKNFAYSQITNTPGTNGTTIVLEIGDGAKFPTVYPYRVTAWPIGQLPTVANAEILQVTNNDGAQTLTVVRNYNDGGYGGGSNQSLGSNYQIAQLITVGILEQILAAPVTSLNSLTGALTVESVTLTITTPGGGNIKIEVPASTYDAFGAAATAQAAAESYALGLIEDLYPVGAVYTSGVHTLPSLLTSFGTWQELTSGGAASGFAFGGVGTGTDAGGASRTVASGANSSANRFEFAHTLAGAEAALPAVTTSSETAIHTHPMNDGGPVDGAGGYITESGGGAPYIFSAAPNGGSGPVNLSVSTDTGITTQGETGHEHNLSAVTPSQALNVTPPMYGLYMWKRTA